MNFTLRSSSNPFNEHERLTRKRQTTSTLNRFLSFNENQSSAVESRRRLLQLTPNLIELLEEDEDNIDDNQELCHECNTCSKLFASEYGLNHHINMHHPNQSTLCSICHITFRSHRSLKTHQQRRHSSIQPKTNSVHLSLPNYSHISSYLVLAFSSKQFPLIAKQACEQEHLPLGCLTSKLYQCHLCHIPFPCSRSLKYHLLHKHEQYEYKLCEKILSGIIAQAEFNLRKLNDNDHDDIESIKLNLAERASQLGLINKQLFKNIRCIKIKQDHLIYPMCLHEKRTCANLCLEHLSSYSRLIQNYPHKFSAIPKGNPFSQGSIVSSISSINNTYSNSLSSLNHSNTSNDLLNGRQKRKNVNRTDSSSLPPVKKTMLSNLTITNAKTNRTNSNNKVFIKQQVEQTTRTNEIKSLSMEQSSALNVSLTLPRKISSKDNYMRPPSVSSNSSTSTRSSTTKTSSSSTNLTRQATVTSQRTPKRSLSPSVATALQKSSQKRHQTRQKRQNITSPSSSSSSSSTAIIKVDDNEDDIEQENDDDDDNDVVAIEVEQPKQKRQNRQRRASGSSIEYVQTLDNDQQLPSSLNNIENIKSKSKINDEEIIICRSPPSTKNFVLAQNKNHSKTSMNGNITRRSTAQQSSNNDERVRVRCKICGEILEGRTRFSQHVMKMHSHLLSKSIPESKHQQQRNCDSSMINNNKKQLSYCV